MKGLITAFTLFLVALTISEVISQAEHDHEAASSMTANQIAHHRSKRSPYEPFIAPSLVGPLLLGKSFLLGSLLGPKIFRGPGWGPARRPGWGWSPPSHGWSRGPGWGGWSSSGPVITVTRGWGSGW